MPAVRGYQQGGLIIYGDDNNYLKLVYSGRSTAAAGSKAANVIQFAKEVNAVASESNSTALGATFPDTVWLRMSSTDGNVVTASYSTDGATWLPITTSNGTAAPRDLTGITSPKVGLLALGSTAAGAADNISAKFDYFTITPDDTAVPCAHALLRRGLQRNRVELGLERRCDPAETSMVVRWLGEDPAGGDSTSTRPPTPRGTWSSPTSPTVRSWPPPRSAAPINRSYQSAGLLIYGDDDNYIKHVFQGRSTGPERRVQHHPDRKETDGAAVETNTAGLGADFPSTVWLRLTSRTATRSSASYSTDGETWTDMSRWLRPDRRHQPADRSARSGQPDRRGRHHRHVRLVHAGRGRHV